MGKRLHDLEGAADPPPAYLERPAARQVLPLEPDLPRIGRVHSGEEVKDGRFARPVRTDETDNLPRPDLKANVLNGGKTPELSST